jgi:PAS domain S-box-containing protein
MSIAMKLKRSLLEAPTFAEEEKNRVAKLLHWTLWTLIVLVVLDCIVLAIFAPETIPSFWLNYLTIAFCFLCLWMLHRGWVIFSSALLSSVFWLLLLYYTAISGGVASPSFGLFYVTIVMAAVLLGTRGALGFGLITIASSVFLYYAGQVGWIVSQEAPPTADRLFGTQTMIIMALTLFTVTSSRSLLGALNRSRESERNLAVQNQELQAEIARRKQAEKEQQRLASILEATSDFVGIAAVNGQVMYINKAGRKLVGLDETFDVTQTRHETYYPEAIRSKILTDVAEAVLREGSWQGESALLASDGSEIPTSQLVLVHYDADKNVEYYSSIMRDISDQKEAESQRLELARQEERLKSFKEFLSHISHDLKTPMTLIHTSFHLMEKQTDPEKRQKRMETIGQQLKLLEKYIQDLLDLSRLDHLPSLTIAPLNLNALLQTIVTRFSTLAETAGITLELQADENLPEISADAYEFERALVNLVENAIHYTPQGGNVKIGAARKEGYVLIEIQDTGIGVKEEDRDAIFERFFRSEGARSLRPSGTGLGLAIVKRIVEIHGGKLSLESRIGQGSRFSITMPLQTLDEKAN